MLAPEPLADAAACRGRIAAQCKAAGAQASRRTTGRRQWRQTRPAAPAAAATPAARGSARRRARAEHRLGGAGRRILESAKAEQLVAELTQAALRGLHARVPRVRTGALSRPRRARNRTASAPTRSPRGSPRTDSSRSSRATPDRLECRTFRGGPGTRWTAPTTSLPSSCCCRVSSGTSAGSSASPSRSLSWLVGPLARLALRLPRQAVARRRAGGAGLREWMGRAIMLLVVLLAGSLIGSLVSHFARRAVGLAARPDAGRGVRPGARRGHRRASSCCGPRGRSSTTSPGGARRAMPAAEAVANWLERYAAAGRDRVRTRRRHGRGGRLTMCGIVGIVGTSPVNQRSMTR